MARLYLLILFCATLASCTNTPTEPTTGNFPASVAGIISNNCLGGDCHSGSSALNTGFDLSSWEAMTKGSVYFNEVIPFSAIKSHLFEHINTNTSIAPSVEPTMPLARDPLSQSDQIAIFNWLNQGAKSADGRVPYENATNKFFVVNSGEDMVSVIDAKTQRLIRVPFVGVNYQPAAITMMPDMKSYLVGMHGAGGLIAKYDAATYTKLSSFVSNLTPSSIALTADGTKGYVTDDSYFGSRFGIFDPVTMTLTKIYSSPFILDPGNIAISPDGQFAYLCGKRSDDILRIRISDDSVVGCLALGPDVPIPVTDAYTGKYLPQKIVISPDSKTMYVSCQNTSEVVVFDLNKDSIIARIPVQLLPWGAALTPDGSELWIAAYGTNEIHILSTATNHVTDVIDSISLFPRAIAFTPDGKTAYVACELSGGGVHHHVTGGAPPSSYVVIDVKSRKVLSTQEIPAASLGIVTGYR